MAGLHPEEWGLVLPCAGQHGALGAVVGTRGAGWQPVLGWLVSMAGNVGILCVCCFSFLTKRLGLASVCLVPWDLAVTV